MEFSDEFLDEVGLGSMPSEQKEAFLRYAQEEAWVRIGEKISEGIAEEKMDEFDQIEGDEAAQAWLEKNRPDYKEIVREVIAGLKEEIRANREKILG